MFFIKLKYCPNCAGMDIFKNSSGLDQCGRCNFTGTMREGGIDEINSARKRILLAKNHPLESTVSKPETSAKITNKELNERLEKLRAKKEEDFEVL